MWQTDGGKLLRRVSKNAEVEMGPEWRWADEGLGYFSLPQEMLTHNRISPQIM